MFKRIVLLGLLLASLALALGPGAGRPLAARPEKSAYQAVPPYIAGAAPPLVMLVLARDQSLFHLAYNDTSDLTGDGRLDIGFNPAFPYYGLFDSYKCYKMGTAGKLKAFVPTRETVKTGSFGSNPKKPEQKEVDPGELGICGGADEWSGNFLNYVTTTRMDALRKVLYGGKRVVDTQASGATPSVTVLESATIGTSDAHVWGKEIYSDERWPDYSPYYDVRKYTPLAKPRDSVTKYTGANKPRNNPAKHFLGVYSYYSGKGGDKGVTTLGVLAQQEVNPSPEYGDKTNVPDEPLIFNWILAEAPLPRPTTELKNDTGGTLTEYSLRVEVCKDGLIGREKCKNYPKGSLKPIGILQKYGDSKQMFYGLISGSYEKNHSGGVLRKNISPFSNEIDVMGHGTIISNFAGIIKTIDSIRISGWSNSKTQYLQNEADQCGYLAARAPYEGECRSWGNPIGEMMFEAIRYFNVQGGPTSAFAATARTHEVEKLLPSPNWANPYDQAELKGYEDCVKPYIMVISDVNLTFDSDQTPGAISESSISSPSFKRLNGNQNDTIHTADLLGLITEHEGLYTDEDGHEQLYFIGQTTKSNYDHVCSPKPLSRSDKGLAGVRGLCPGEPTRQGGYSAAAMALFANTHVMHTGTGASGESVDVPNATTFAVALASPLPNIDIPVKGRTISLVPFGKTYFGHRTGSSISYDYGSYMTLPVDRSPGEFQPTNTIVNLFIKQWDLDDDGRPCAGAFDVNFEYLEQGGNYDMDAIVRYSFSLIRANCTGSDCDSLKVTDVYGHIGPKNTAYYKVRNKAEAKADDVVGIWLHLNSYYAASFARQNLGYVISGTTADGPYLVVSDFDTTKSEGQTYYLNRPDVCVSFNDTSSACRGSNGAGVAFYGGSGSPYLNSTRFFKPSTAGDKTAKMLPNPLWLAAKYGGFTDYDGNGLPDDPKDGRGSEWNADGKGDPDTYFYVSNPSKMEEQIDSAFSAILQQAAQGSASGVSNDTSSGQGLAFKPLFYPLQSDGADDLYWGGYLQTLFIDKNGYYRENTEQTLGGDPVLDPDDLIVTFSGTADGSVDIRFWKDREFTGVLAAENEDTSRRTTDLKEIRYIWEAGSLLAGADGSASGTRSPFENGNTQARYLFTHADLNNDQAVAGSPAAPGGNSEVPMFSPANSTTRGNLGPYLRASAVRVVGSGAKTIMFQAKEEGPSGGDISVAVQTASSIGGNVDVSVSGRAITVKIKNSSVTAKAVVDAVNQDSAASLLVTALLPSGDRDGAWNAPVASAAKLSYDQGVELLMNYVIGNAVPNWRGRNFMVGGQKLIWRFGDPIHSSPLSMAGPAQNFDVRYRDDSYRAYKRAHANRRNMVFIGTNDGFLHAINAGFPSITPDGDLTYLKSLGPQNKAWPLGMEIWGYIPQAVLPHLRWLTDSSNFHTYMVDLTPKLIDVKNPSGDWRTILVCGLRLGGNSIDVSEAFALSGANSKVIRSEVFALDVTDPETPPKLLWSYSGDKLGMTTSRPSWLRAGDKWYVVFGSGPVSAPAFVYEGHSTENPRIILLDAWTGREERLWEIADMGHGYLSEPAVIRATERTVSGTEVEWTNPLVLFGVTSQSADPYRATGGGIYQLSVGQPASTSTWSPSPVIKGLGAITSAPAAFFNCANKLWLYAGTGRYWSLNDANPCSSYCTPLKADSTEAEKENCKQCKAANVNYFVGLRRDGVEDNHTIDPNTELVDVSKVVVSGDGENTVYNEGGTTYSESEYRNMREGKFSSGIRGYKLPLIDENEIALHQPVTVSDSSCGCMLFFTTYVPPQKICSYTGSAYLYAVDCFLGTATSKTQKFTGRDSSGIYNNRISIGVGMPLALGLVAIGDKLMLKVGDATGFETSEVVGERDTLSTGMKAWREEQRGFGEDFEIVTP